MRARGAAYRAIQAFARLMVVLLWRFTCRGLGRIPRRGGVLIVSNHQSVLDLPLVGCCVPRQLTYVARATLGGSFVFRAMTWPFDVLDLRRGESDVAAIRGILERLHRGAAVLLFPEGTRTRDGRLGAIREGFLMIAERARVPVVPMRIEGAFGVWPRGRSLPGRGRLRASVGPPILCRRGMDRAEALRRVREALTLHGPSPTQS